MSKDVDAAVARFEARNAGAAEAEREQTRQSRIVILNAQELLFRAIAGAAFQACKRLGVDPARAHGELVPNEQTRRFEVNLVLESGVDQARNPDNAEIQAVMAEEFAAASALMDVEKRRFATIVDAFPAAEPVERDEAIARIRAFAASG